LKFYRKEILPKKQAPQKKQKAKEVKNYLLGIILLFYYLFLKKINCFVWAIAL
jgi:hypothetical protein